MKDNLKQVKKMETEYKYMVTDNIMKVNGKMDINTDKDTYSSVIEAIVVEVSWIISLMDMLSIIGQDKRNIEDNGFLINVKDEE